MKKIAINGFGRIGRLFFRQIFGHPEIKVVAINDLGEIDNLAYLLKYDSTYRSFEKNIKVEGGELVVGEQRIKILNEKNLLKLPWGDLNIDVVVEATGVFTSFLKANYHIEAGAKRVVITAPAKDQDGVNNGKTVLMGVNDKELTNTNLTCNGSCTTNAVGVIMAVMESEIGVTKAILNTIHGYTSSQSLVDSPKSGKFARGRAAAQNIVLSTTGAAIAVSRALPALDKLFDGVATRVPVLAGSVADITFMAKRNTTVEEVNDILERASHNPIYKNVLKVVSDPIVSSDIIGEPYGSVVDLNFTRVVGGDLVKIMAWYDNEWGYVSTLVNHVLHIKTQP